jgi:dTDP-4-amino-4,6-dideoxygalactose transaminase
MGQRMGGRPGGCPVSEAKSERLVRLPFYNRLNPEDQDRVIRAIHEFHV